jgi:hypothetical protein
MAAAPTSPEIPHFRNIYNTSPVAVAAKNSSLK